jgi:antitoxin VapB
VALNIKDKETEALVSKIASLTGETETEAVRQAATERLDRLERGRSQPGRFTGGGRFSGPRRLDYDPKQDAETFHYWLETEIWPLLKEENRGKPITKAEREELLGYGPGGV